jgi:hypothetical protein
VSVAHRRSRTPPRLLTAAARATGTSMPPVRRSWRLQGPCRRERGRLPIDVKVDGEAGRVAGDGHVGDVRGRVLLGPEAERRTDRYGAGVLPGAVRAGVARGRQRELGEALGTFGRGRRAQARDEVLPDEVEQRLRRDGLRRGDRDDGLALGKDQRVLAVRTVHAEPLAAHPHLVAVPLQPLGVRVLAVVGGDVGCARELGPAPRAAPAGPASARRTRTAERTRPGRTS